MTDTLRQAVRDAGGLVNQGDLSRLWQLSRVRVSELAADPTFPAPVAEIGGRNVYALAEVQAWRKARKAARA